LVEFGVDLFEYRRQRLRRFHVEASKLARPSGRLSIPSPDHPAMQGQIEFSVRFPRMSSRSLAMWSETCRILSADHIAMLSRVCARSIDCGVSHAP
jgi:hypothetical protein